MVDQRKQTLPRDPLATERLLQIFFVLSVSLLVVLALAPAKDYFTEWRALQNEYNDLAARRGLAPMEVGIQQIWVPARGVVDRCVTCHVGMGTKATPIEGHPVFGAHPPTPHEPASFGCVSCHQGQGRATTKEHAHGEGAHVEWEHPMTAAAYTEAGCGSCHASVKIPPTDVLARGRYLFDLHGCLSCHKVAGEGGVVGPDLSAVGLKGFDRDWHERHLTDPGALVEGSKMMNFGHLSQGEMDALIAYMDTLVGAPKLIAGKAVANTHGCRGCHTIRGVGGDLGPALDGEGEKPRESFDFTHVEGPHTVANWQRQHLAAPAKVVPGSRMPPPGLSEEEMEQLTTYLLSLRRDGLSLDQHQKGEAIARLRGDKDHGTTGADVYRVYCSACHGQAGEGRVLDQLGTRVPAIAGPDFLAVASDNFLYHTLMQGRPGRDMPGWGAKAGGLDTEEIDAVIAHLRSREPTPPSFEAVMAALGDVDLGRRLFQGQCSTCHGAQGDGTVLAPSLVNDEFLTIASERFLYDTIVKGRPDTAMPAHRDLSPVQARSLMAFLDSHRSKPRVDVSGYRAKGSRSYGKTIYEGHCAACHGHDGGGSVGPALANQAFLRAASDGFLAASIREGRGNRAMRAFGRGRGGIVELFDREIDDVVAYIRSWQDPSSRVVLKGKAQGEPVRGMENFTRMCAGCHGIDGLGGLAPALNNPGFLAAASDGFLQATILKGRAGTAMRSWGQHGFAELSPQDVNDIIAAIRTWDRKDTP